MRKFSLLFCAAIFPLLLHAQTLIYHSMFNGNANDLSGNGFDGLMGGVPGGGASPPFNPSAPTVTSGQTGAPGTALFFDGIDDFIELPTNAAFNLTTWTLQALIRPEGFYGGTCQSNAIIWHGTQFTPNYYGLFFNDNYVDHSCTVINTAGNVFGANPAGNPFPQPNFAPPICSLNTPITLNTWYCVTATYDGSNIRIYRDGLQVANGPWPNLYNYSLGPIVPVLIGHSNDPVYPYWFHGRMDEVSIWSGVMSPTNIAGFCIKAHAGNWKQMQNGGADEEAIANGRAELNMPLLEGDMKVYPSPAQDAVNIDLPVSFNGGDLVIMNGVGQVLHQQKAATGKLTVDISKYPTGIYIVKVFKDGARKVERFTKN